MRHLALTLLLLLLFTRLTHAQTDSSHLVNITAKLQKLSATRPAEKIYLHFNKPAYSIGDTIWFKDYLTVGAHHQPSALSGIVYAELIDPKDKIIKALKLKNNGGISTGQFVLDDKLVPGDYRIRAYTNWMRNAGPDYFFNQTINVSDIKTGAVFITSTLDASAQSNDNLVHTKLY